MASTPARLLTIGVEEIVIGRTDAAQEQALADHDPDRQRQHDREDADDDPRIERQRGEQDAEVIMAAALDLLGGIEGQELGALTLGSGGKLEGRLRQRSASNAEFVDFAGEADAELGRAGRGASAPVTSPAGWPLM